MPSTSSKNVEAARVCFSVGDIDEHIQFESSHIYVRGLPWTISLNKDAGCTVSVAQIKSFGQISFKSSKWVIVARVTVKILSPQTDEELYTVFMGPRMFSSDELALAKASLFPWEELIKPEMRYINDKKCVFEVLIEAGPLQSSVGDDWLMMKTIQDCCQFCSHARFQFEVVKSNGFFGVCSPEFNVQKVKFRAAVVKSDDKVKVQLYKMRDITLKQRGKATVRCSLSSFDPRIKTVVMDMTFKYHPEFWYLNLFEIEWSKLTNPMERFVLNNSFIIDLIMNIELDGSAAKANKTPYLYEQPSIRLECPVCMEDMVGKPISSTRCGHMFHTVCVAEAMQTRNICPVCKRPSPKIHEIYLPLK